MNAPKARSTAIPSPSGGSRPRTVRGVPATTLLWASVVLILGLILVTQRISRPRSNTLPVPPIVAPVDRILFAEADDQVELRLRDGDWVIGEAEYPASGTVADLVEALTALETVDVVSARGRFADYGVGDDEGRRIRVFSGSTEPLAVRLGAAAAAGDGVYGRLNAGREVVLLPRNIDDAFTLEVDQLRETAMVRIEEDEILQVEIAIGDSRPILVVRGAGTADGDGFAWEVEQLTENTAPAGDTGTDDSLDPDPADFRSLFQELDPLRAETFLTGAPEGDAFAVITVTRTDGETEEIRIYPAEESGDYPVTTRSSEYAFAVPQWRVRRLLLGHDPV
jgi:hypothetical protein